MESENRQLIIALVKKISELQNKVRVLEGKQKQPKKQGGNVFSDALNIASHIPFSPVAGLTTLPGMLGLGEEKPKRIRRAPAKKGRKTGGNVFSDVLGTISNIANAGDVVAKEVAPMVFGL